MLFDRKYFGELFSNRGGEISKINIFTRFYKQQVILHKL